MEHRIVRRLAAFLAMAILAVCGLAACSDDGETLAERVESGHAKPVAKATENLDIARSIPGGKRPKGIEKDTWTVLVYLCGSDLETEGGAATADLAEMVAASGSERVSFVVETGGAKKWKGEVKSKQLQRFFIQDGSIMEVGHAKSSSMGNPDTLTEFLSWGLREYPADHMGLILWNHGGGSVSGVCFDERSDYDALTLPEMAKTFDAVNDTLWQKFDFVGFDACLMGTIELANVLAPFADYMIASQESEPATGWEYGAITEYLAEHPSANGAELGQALCDGYLDSLSKSDVAEATLSVVDLSHIDELIQSFYHFSQEMYEAGSDQETLAAMSRSIKAAESYGGNNWLEGYTNMVDLGGVVDACAEIAPSTGEVKDAIEDAVSYQVRGKHHADSCGLSLYYPLSIGDSDELAGFTQVAVNPSYLSYVDRLAHGATYDGGEEYESYSDEGWFEGDFWEWLFSDEEMDEENQEQVEQETDEYWSYLDDHDSESQVITFDEEPQVSDEGYFWFRLDEQGLNNTATVSGLVYTLSDDGRDWFALGETYDVYGDWDTGEFSDGFDGRWLSLPDGQNLCLYVEGEDDDSILYTSPISLNGTDCYLRLRQNVDSGAVTVEGAWGGIEESGAVGRGTVPLSKGDVIVPLYDAYSADGGEELTYEGNPYKVGKKGLKIRYDHLPAAVYEYSFLIEDCFGDSMQTESVTFKIDKRGEISYE